MKWKKLNKWKVMSVFCESETTQWSVKNSREVVISCKFSIILKINWFNTMLNDDDM